MVGSLTGRDVLALLGGGQQACVLAAAGAHVTLLDNPAGAAGAGPDGRRARRAGDPVEQGDMRDPSRFGGRFVRSAFHPCSNGFVPDVRPSGASARRVLRPGGRLLAGIVNPALKFVRGRRRGSAASSWRSTRCPTATSFHATRPAGAHGRGGRARVSFSHTLDDQIGGQLDAGLQLAGFFEDRWAEQRWTGSSRRASRRWR